MNPIPTVRIKTDAKDNPHGYIVINQSDFDEKLHVLHEGGGTAPAVEPGVTREYLDVSLAALPGEQNDPDYVVNSMRAYFGEVFTADDEAKVRAVVKAPRGKLPIAELRAYLDGKDIAYPADAKKADLQALYDADVGAA